MVRTPPPLPLPPSQSRREEEYRCNAESEWRVAQTKQEAQLSPRDRAMRRVN